MYSLITLGFLGFFDNYFYYFCTFYNIFRNKIALVKITYKKVVVIFLKKLIMSSEYLAALIEVLQVAIH